MRRIAIAIAALAIASAAGASPVDNAGLALPERHITVSSITEYTDYAAWSAAVGAQTSNRYAELGAGVTVTNQYTGVGATYTDGNDVTVSAGFLTDGMMLNGNGDVNITLGFPVLAIGVNFPGALRISGYSGVNPVFTSSDFAGSGTGFFGGVVSTVAFDRVVLHDWVDSLVFPDDVFYTRDVVSVEPRSWGAVRQLYR